MKTFKIILKSSEYYTKEIQAKDYEDALKQAKDQLWQGNFYDWDIDNEDRCVSDVEEIN